MTARALLAGAAVLGLTTLSPWLPAARANARVDTEESRIGEILQSALVAHGAEVHRCFERALADTLEVAGKIELAVDVGPGGKVTKASPALDEVKSPVLLACLTESAVTWTLAGLDPGSTVIVPLSFEGQTAQFTIKVKDAPDRGPGSAPGKKRGPGPAATPPFSVKLLVDEATMRASKAAMTQLTVAPANRIAMHKHPGAEVLYVLKGKARILGPAGVGPEKLDEGMAIYIPPNMPHVIENMGRSAPAVLLDIFVPMGPERVFRDPQDPEGRAAFEIVRDAKPTAPPGAKFIVASAADAETLSWSPPGKPKLVARPLFEPSKTGNRGIYVGVLEAEPRAVVPRNSHPGSAEILFVLSGGGDLTVGSERSPSAPTRRCTSRKVSRTRRGSPAATRRSCFRSSPPRARRSATGTCPPPPRSSRASRTSHQEPMIDFELTEEQLILQAAVREMCERLIIPNARQWDKEERFPIEIIPALGEMGLLGMQIPEAYGGAGMKFADYVVALEEVAHADASVGLTMASHNSLCTGHINLAGNDAQRAKYLPRLASGKALGAWGLTEPGVRLRRRGGAHPRRAQGRRLGHHRHEDVHHPGLGRADLRHPRVDEPREEGQGADRVRRRARHAGFSYRQEDREAGPARLRHHRADPGGRSRSPTSSAWARSTPGSSTP